MATKSLKVTNEWQKVGNGESVVLQNRGTEFVEVATVKSGEAPESGFILNDYEIFSYPGGDEVWVRCKSGTSYITIDNVGV